jgi:EcsC protein family
LDLGAADAGIKPAFASFGQPCPVAGFVRRGAASSVSAAMSETLPAIPLHPPPLDPAATAELASAVRLLEEDRFTGRVAALIGRATGGGMHWARRLLPTAAFPEQAVALAQDAAAAALRAALAAATWRLGGARPRVPTWMRTASVAVTGAAGGAAGLPGTLVELPATTALLLREIARIAAEEGEDLGTEEARAECLAVFALGGPEGEGGYYAARLALAEVIGGAAGLALGDVMPRLLAAVAARFGVPVAWKVAGQAVPVAGAAAGAVVNTLFMQHFRARARGHFIVRRLERRFGAEAVRTAYATLRERYRLRRA